MSTHADLSFHVLRYALQRVHEGDLSAALDLGFTVDEIRSMERLTLKALGHLSRLSAHFLRVEVDHETYRAMISRVTEESESEGTQDALLRAGAPRALMAQMYGWSALQYAHRRRLLGIVGISGRPPQPTEAEEAMVWRHWRLNATAPLAQRYLRAATASGVTVAIVHSLVRAWEEAGFTPAPRGISPLRSRARPSPEPRQAGEVS
jgi:hypothetical protein